MLISAGARGGGGGAGSGLVVFDHQMGVDLSTECRLCVLFACV